MISILFIISVLCIMVSNGSDATLYARCDNQGTYYKSTNGGSSYTQVFYEADWTDLVTLTISDVTSDTILKMVCVDVGYIGGFLATIEYNGNEYYTSSPLSNSNFEVDIDSNDIVYYSKTSSPWNKDDDSINDNSYWIWDDNTYNTVTFIFDFGNVIESTSIYIGISDDQTYENAKADCSSLASISVVGQLATWGSGYDFNAIKAVRDDLDNNPWVGLDDLGSEAYWQFVDGDEDYCVESSSDGVCDELPQWYPGEPNDAGNNEDCAELYSNGYLNDIPCSNSKPFICEIIISGSTSAQAAVSIPINPIGVSIPNNNQPFDNNVYIFEFTSNQGIVLFFSLLLNILLLSFICYTMVKWTKVGIYGKKNKYSKVINVYSDGEDSEKNAINQ